MKTNKIKFKIYQIRMSNAFKLSIDISFLTLNK